MTDVINHPPHYNSGKIEVIEFIEDQNLGFSLGNAIKYIARAGKKLPDKSNNDERARLTVQDLEKARWYIARHIELILAEAQDREPKRPNEMSNK